MTQPHRLAHLRRRGRRAGVLAGRALAIALSLVTSACINFGGSDSATTDSARAKVTTSTTRPRTAIAGGPRTPKTLPGGFPAPVSLEGVTVKLREVGKIEEPTAFTTRPGYPNYYLTERKGRVRQLTVDLQYDKDGKLIRTGYYVERGYVLDLAREVSTDGARGMLGIAYSSDGRTMYVGFTDKEGRLRVSSWRVYDYSVDPSTRRDILSIDHPRNDRNGLGMAMGPDGFLYVGTGDGGGPGDPDNTAQNTKSLLGKVLRIDPGGGLGDFPYGVPDSNPFKDGTGGSPEVWAFGLANPAHLRFDKLTKELWVADSAGADIEEINYLPLDGSDAAGRGANLGWNGLQGSRPFGANAAPAGATPPVFEYAHLAGECGVVGGGLYRGIAVLGMAGAYVYGDFCTGELRGVITDGGTLLDQRPLGLSLPPRTLSGFGETEDGELWVLCLDGRIFRLDQG